MRHLHKSKRARNLRIAIFAIVIAALIYTLGWSGLLAVKKIEISGTSQIDLISRDLSRDHIALHQNMQLARVDVKAISHSILSHTWVANAIISRNWFAGTVKIVLTERTPVAEFTTTSGETEYFDASGANFTYPSPFIALPKVTLQSGGELSRKSAAGLISQLPSDQLAGLIDLVVYSPNKIIMDIRMGNRSLRINWGDSSEISLKNKVLGALLLLPENQKISNVDLSNPREPITK